MDVSKIELKYQENIKPYLKWQFDQIDAFLGDEYLGYIRIAYINEEKIATLRKMPLLLAYDILHKTELFKESYNPSSRGPAEHTYISKYYLQARYTAQMLYTDKELDKHYAAIETWNDEQLQEYVNKHNAKIFQTLLKNEHIKKHAEYHFCRPDVDYIQVFEKYQKNGVGTLLYRAASKWMNEKGMVLHSSTLQQEGAVRSWEKMLKNNEADVLLIKGHQKKRYRYVKDVDPKWLSDKIVLRTAKIPNKNFKKAVL